MDNGWIGMEIRHSTISPTKIQKIFDIVLFALNYVWLWTMFTGETKIMGLVIGLFLLGFVIFAIHTLRKDKKNKESKGQIPE